MCGSCYQTPIFISVLSGWNLRLGTGFFPSCVFYLNKAESIETYIKRLNEVNRLYCIQICLIMPKLCILSTLLKTSS